jgi:hypothetical protein
VSVMKVQPSISKFRPLRLWLPYCKCEFELNDGTEVLLNRDYTPIWQRLTTGEVRHIEPETYIDSKPLIGISTTVLHLIITIKSLWNYV